MADNDFIKMLKAMPEAEASALVERMFFDTWGVTREKLMELSGEEIVAIAEARGISVAGKGFSHTGDGKDHRN